MTAPLTQQHTFLILEAAHGMDDTQRENFVDFVAGELSENLDPTDDDVDRAIYLAKQALRKARAH